MLRIALYGAGGLILLNILAPGLWRDLQYATGEMLARQAVRAYRNGGAPAQVGQTLDQMTAQVLSAPFAQGAMHGLADESGNAQLQEFIKMLLPTPVEGT